MGPIRHTVELPPALAAAAIFLCAGFSIASIFWKMDRIEVESGSWATYMAMTSAVMFLCASILVFFRPKVFRLNPGYALGGIAGAVALPWFVQVESSARPSVWTLLNGPDEYAAMDAPYATSIILSVALIAAATACSFLRLLPGRLSLRNSPLRHRTWPALAVAVLVTAGWLFHSAKPWMLPSIVDAVPPELRILHVEKQGLHFHETSAISMRNGSYWVSHNDRRLFQYRFPSLVASGVLPHQIQERAAVLTHSPSLRALRTAPPVRLRSWNAEGWYISLSSSPELLAFTSEYHTKPPQEIQDFFRQIAKLPGTHQSLMIKDVCLGFCYDPISGLGFWYWNQRCHETADGIVQCL